MDEVFAESIRRPRLMADLLGWLSFLAHIRAIVRFEIPPHRE
jgi:hypothetical protein